MASRRKAREALLRAIYLSESRGFSYEAAFREMETYDKMAEMDEEDMEKMKPFSLGLDDKQKEMAFALARFIDQDREKYNEQITKTLVNWDFSRVSRIDRIIMWIALAEMNHMLDVPPRVSMNEALELAKKYSSTKSVSFINGILDAVCTNTGIKTRG